MNGPPSLGEIQLIKAEYLRAFRDWLKVPEQILSTSVRLRKPERQEMCALLERSWRKLKQDLSGCLALINTKHIGPACAVSRVCRENALRMLLWSFSNPELDAAHVYVALKARPKEDARRLVKDAQAFLSRVDYEIDERARNYLERGIASANEILNEPGDAPRIGLELATKKGFARIAEIAANRLIDNGLDPSLLAVQMMDYWLECEAVHSGRHAGLFYKPEGFGLGLELDGELTCICRLNDLYPIKPIVTAALINALGLTGKLPPPDESTQLHSIAKKAESVVRDITRNRSGEPGNADHESNAQCPEVGEPQMESSTLGFALEIVGRVALIVVASVSAMFAWWLPLLLAPVFWQFWDGIVCRGSRIEAPFPKLIADVIT